MYQVIWESKGKSYEKTVKDEASLALFFSSLKGQDISNLQTFFCCAGQRILTGIVA